MIRTIRQIVRTSVVLFSGIVCLPVAVQAGLIGQTIHAEYLSPNQSTVLADLGTKVVNPTATFNNGSQSVAVVSDQNITITNSSGTYLTYDPSGTFNGYDFIDTSHQLGVSSITIDPATTVASFTLADVMFTADSIYVNFQGVSIPNNSIISLDLHFSAVPGPSTFLMSLSAIPLICGYWWRAKPLWVQ